MTRRLPVAAVVAATLTLTACVPKPSAQPQPYTTQRPNVLVEKPGTGPAATYLGTPLYHPCAILTSDVITTAGLKYGLNPKFGGTRLSPGEDRPELAGATFEPMSCTSDVEPAPGRLSSPSITFTTLNSKLASATQRRSAALPRIGDEPKTAHGVTYAHVKPAGEHEVTLAFDDGDRGTGNTFTLTVRDFESLDGGDATLAKIADGIAKNIADGPRPMPEHTYPEPYNLTAKPCDALPPEIFTTVTGKPTNGMQKDLFARDEFPSLSHTSIEITCERSARLTHADPGVLAMSVSQTIYAEGPETATNATQEICAYQTKHKKTGVLDQPVGDTSCAVLGDDLTGGASVWFHSGRTLVVVTLLADSITGPPAVTAVNKGAQQIYDLLNH